MVDSTCTGGGITSTPQTAQWINNHTAGNSCDNEGGATAAGGTTSLSWTGGDDTWLMLGGSFKAAAASTATFDSYGYDRSFVTSYPLTVGSQSNRALAVFVNIGTEGDTSPTVSGVTYAGVALTQIVHKVGTDGHSIGDLWALPAGTQPASGTNNVVITLSGPLGYDQSLRSGAISAYNVDQTTTFTSTGSNAGKSASATLALASSGANDLVIDSACNGTGLTSTPQSELWKYNEQDLSYCGTEGGAWAGGGTTSLSWTVPNDWWIMVGASFKAAAGSTATLDAFANNANGSFPANYLATYPLTVGSQSNRALAVFVHVPYSNYLSADTNFQDVRGVTYAGIPLTRIVHKLGTDGYSTGDLWALPAGTQPASGTNNVVVTFRYLPANNTTNLTSGAISASGVDQNTTFTSTNSKAGKSTNANVTLATSDANGLVIDSTCNGTSITSTAQTQQWKYSYSGNTCGSQGGATAAGGTTSLSWTVGNDYWIMLAASFRSVVKHRVTTY